MVYIDREYCRMQAGSGFRPGWAVRRLQHAGRQQHLRLLRALCGSRNRSCRYSHRQPQRDGSGIVRSRPRGMWGTHHRCALLQQHPIGSEPQFRARFPRALWGCRSGQPVRRLRLLRSAPVCAGARARRRDGHAAHDGLRALPADVDVVFFAVGATGSTIVPAAAAEPGPSLIAIVDFENPTALRSLLDTNAHSVVAKPIRASGTVLKLPVRKSP